MINPFQYGGIVGPEAFCNREQERHDLTRAATNGDRLLVFAERRLGDHRVCERTGLPGINMIHTDTEYKRALQKLKEDARYVEQQRSHLQEMDLSPDEVGADIVAFEDADWIETRTPTDLHLVHGDEEGRDAVWLWQGLSFHR